MLDDSRLFRSWRSGVANHVTYLEDYASLILALLNHYNSDPDPKWFTNALQLTETMIQHFYNSEEELFFDTPDDHEPLLIRPRDLQDNATPSGNALAALALLQLSAFSGNGEWRDLAETMLNNINEMATRYPTGFAQWLCAMDFALTPTQEIAILGVQDSPDFQALTEVLWATYRPHLVAALSNSAIEPRSPELLENRQLVDQKATAYVCQNFVCQHPVTTPDDFRNQLDTPT